MIFFRQKTEPQDTYNHFMLLMKEISDLNRTIVELKNERSPRIAMEAIDRFCPPTLYKYAIKWLESHN